MSTQYPHSPREWRRVQGELREKLAQKFDGPEGGAGGAMLRAPSRMRTRVPSRCFPVRFFLSVSFTLLFVIGMTLNIIGQAVDVAEEWVASLATKVKEANESND